MSQELNWIQALPKGWKAIPLKAIARYSVSSVDKIPKEEEISVELCNYTDVYKNDLITKGMEFMQSSATEEEIQKFQLMVGDVLITKDSESWNDIAIPALVVETKENLLCGYHLAIIRSDQRNLIPEYLFRCIEAKTIRIQLELASTGVTRFGLPKHEIGRLKLPIPDISIQRLVVSFLKSELHYIDRLIIQKEKFSNLLSEKRQALINQAVTKGLDSNIELKNSGVDWLDDIPEHWGYLALKRIVATKITDGPHETPVFVSDGVPFISAESIKAEIIDFDYCRGYIDQSSDDIYSKKCKPKMNDILLVKSGSTTGKVAMVTTDINFNIWSPLALIRANEKLVASHYLFYSLLSSQFKKQVELFWSFGTQPNIGMNVIENLKIAIPPLIEQDIITRYVREKNQKSDLLFHKVTESINLLKERRSALISAAVSGQAKIPVV